MNQYVAPIVLVVALLLVGCADSIEKAGIGKLKVDCQVFTKIVATVPTTCIEYESGREIGNAKAEMYLIEDGKQVKVMSFEIKGIKAFEGQAAAAEAIKDMTDKVSGSVERVLPDIVSKIIRGPLP